MESLEELFILQKRIIETVPHGFRPGSTESVVAAMGLYEEVAEIMDIVSWKIWRQSKWDKEKLEEELSDALHYILELCILNGITSKGLTEAFEKKHKINMERYRLANKGDFSWDIKPGGEL